MQNSPALKRRGNKRLPRKANKVTQLIAQAGRARKLASECGSETIADLYEIHARICEQNALSWQHRGRS